MGDNDVGFHKRNVIDKSFPRTLHDANCVPAPDMPPGILKDNKPIAKGLITSEASDERLIRGGSIMPSQE